MKIFTTLLFAGIITLSGCSKKIGHPEASPFVSIANVSPTLATYNIYLNSSRVTAAAVPFGGVIGYQALLPGTIAVKFTNGGTDELILERSLSISNEKMYSLFLIGKDQQREILQVEDQFPERNADKAYVRFINLSPDAPALDVQLSEGAASIATARSYKQHSAFTPVSAGTHSFIIKEVDAQQAKFTFSNQTLVAGKAYTIIAVGLTAAGELDKPFGAQLVTNY
ncbi:DUF4397 domain-containing protein [Pedobacter sp. SYP-B3415]|uniref:DUF4397 domain-containing protein n=1 Tax=Pedobacter sp. SYP-B3415 TaxID=2496641 RepID=UPI00101CBE2F|nr:DUF4397 domain-containing protein [Pedobacter sp. SYP-B3415]